MNNIGIIIQARTGSTRLPGKIMKKIEGKTILNIMLERLSFSKYYKNVIVATTNNSKDDVIINLCKNLRVKHFRGDEENVLDRYYKCAKHYNINTIVRLTSDCPLIDPFILDEMIDEYRNNGFYIYSNVHPRTYPDGMDIEIFPFIILKIENNRETNDFVREHVTTNIFNNYVSTNKEYYSNFSSIRLTLDYEKDFKIIKKIYKNLYKEGECFTLSDILKFLGA